MRAGRGAGASGAGAGSALRRRGVRLPGFARAPRGPRSLWDWRWGAPSRQPSAGGSDSAAGRRGVRARPLHSPQPRLERAGALLELPSEPSLRLQGGGPARDGRQAGLAGSGSRFAPGNRRAWGAWREAAGRPRSGAPVLTNRVSHGWSEVLFLKRLQGGHKQPPTSLSVRAVDCQSCAGQGAAAVHLALERWDCLAGGRGLLGSPAPQPSWRPGTRPSSRKAGECRCPAAGIRG